MAKNQATAQAGIRRRGLDGSYNYRRGSISLNRYQGVRRNRLRAAIDRPKGGTGYRGGIGAEPGRCVCGPLWLAIFGRAVDRAPTAGLPPHVWGILLAQFGVGNRECVQNAVSRPEHLPCKETR
jgi:hypothetical protein